MIKSPVLLITFNRPDTTQKVFNAIKKGKPSKLYVYNDGPRKGNKEDEEAREEIRQIIIKVDWDCELVQYFSEENLGCGYAVTNAITWAFEQEDRIIILEDDCLPALPFFSYCNTLLEKYRDDTRICMISGNNYSIDKNATNDSYFFSKYGHIWGWATWKRSWDKFDFEMKDWPSFKHKKQIRNVFVGETERRFFTRYFNDIFNNDEKDAWAPQWFYCRIKEYGFSIVPKYNLVTNIGVQGVHTQSKSIAHFTEVNEAYEILEEPTYILCNSYYDEYHFKNHINRRTILFIKVYKKIKKILLKLK